jgi:transposase-like protein
MGSESPTTRRRYGADVKAQVMAACDEPGASVAKIAMAHGINANFVHRRIAAICSSVYRLFRMISSRIEEPIFWQILERRNRGRRQTSKALEASTATRQRFHMRAGAQTMPCVCTVLV